MTLTIWKECQTQGQLAEAKALFEKTRCSRSDHAPDCINDAAEDQVQKDILLDQKSERIQEGLHCDLLPDDGLSGIFHV